MRVIHTTKTIALTPVAIVTRGAYRVQARASRVGRYVKRVHELVDESVTEKERTRQQLNAEKALCKLAEKQNS